jgi:hypothetical protein
MDWLSVELCYGSVMDWQVSGGMEEGWNMVGVLVADSRVGLGFKMNWRIIDRFGKCSCIGIVLEDLKWIGMDWIGLDLWIGMGVFIDWRWIGTTFMLRSSSAETGGLSS